MKILFKTFFISIIFLPAISYAEDAIDISVRLLGGLQRIINISIPIVVGLAILAFFWGLVRYIWSQGSEGKVEAKKVMLYSLFAVFVMVSLYGIIALAQSTFGVDQTGNFTAPRVNTGGGGAPGAGSNRPAQGNDSIEI